MTPTHTTVGEADRRAPDWQADRAAIARLARVMREEHVADAISMELRRVMWRHMLDFERHVDHRPPPASS